MAIFGFSILISLQAYTDALVAYKQDSRAAMAHVPVVETPPPQETEESAAPEVPKNETLVNNYIERFSPVAVAEMKKFGIPASIALAQGIIESRSGNSILAVKANNHFGIKCFSSRCRRGHCINMHDDHAKDFFRKYGSAWESYRAHSKLLANGRYAKLLKHGKDYRKWAMGLKRLGYATDRTYAEKLIGVIEKYDLHKYDR